MCVLKLSAYVARRVLMLQSVIAVSSHDLGCFTALDNKQQSLLRMSSVLRVCLPAQLGGPCSKLNPHLVVVVVDDELTGVFLAFAFQLKPRYFQPFLDTFTPLCTSLDSDEAAPLKSAKALKHEIANRGIRDMFGVVLLGSCAVRDSYSPELIQNAFATVMKAKPRLPETTLVITADSIQYVCVCSV